MAPWDQSTRQARVDPIRNLLEIALAITCTAIAHPAIPMGIVFIVRMSARALSLQSIMGHVTALSHHVRDVVGQSPDEKVGRIDAPAVIAMV